jgi:hypothetical protein
LRDNHPAGQEIPSRSASTGFHVPGSFIRLMYVTILCANVLLIFGTLLSSLGFTVRGLGQFDLKLEGNFATWYSSALLLLAAGAALVISMSPAPGRSPLFMYRVAWTGTSLMLLALSVAAMTALHERLGLWFTDQFGPISGLTEGGAGIYSWLVVLLPFVAVFIVGMAAMIRSWLRVNRKSRNLAVAALACWIGALGAEFIESQLARMSLYSSVEGVFEEGLEITGTALFLASFCEFLRSQKALEDERL